MRVPEHILPDGWQQSADGVVLICPHGHRIAQDGECPDGCVSPLREQGLI
jgi:hypothetical protein